jgi:hypothetical protein
VLSLVKWSVLFIVCKDGEVEWGGNTKIMLQPRGERPTPDKGSLSWLEYQTKRDLIKSE